ncbi:MAG: hypothetical protein U0T83_04870 [Bacteriovoracaceae bacterium]
MSSTIQQITEYLGDEAQSLLKHKAKYSADHLTLPGPGYMEKTFYNSDRNNRVLGSLEKIFNTGRLANTGFVSILPVDQGIEHSGGHHLLQIPITLILKIL